MKKYPCYLFDLDGTLLDTIDLVYECFRHVAQNIKGFHLERKDVISYIGIPLKNQYKHFFPDDSEEAFEHYMKIHMDYQYQIYKDYLKAFPGAKETLATLKANGAKIGLVTSRRKKSAILFTQDTGLFEYFDVMVTPEDTEKHKPDPEPARFALSCLGMKPEDSLFVGDAEFDMECGHAAGTNTAFCLWGTNDPEKLKVKPTILLGTLEDLLR